MRRSLRGWVRRFIAKDEGDIEDLRELMLYRDEVDNAIAEVVRTVHDSGRWSWTDIARATGHSREAAWQRWGRP